MEFNDMMGVSTNLIIGLEFYVNLYGTLSSHHFLWSKKAIDYDT